MAIRYQREEGLAAAEYIACVGQTTLGAGRPIGNPERVQAMIDESDLVVTARNADGLLVGLSRTITDWHWVAYCMDLAVVEGQQGGGVGKALLDETVRILGKGGSGASAASRRRRLLPPYWHERLSRLLAQA